MTQQRWWPLACLALLAVAAVAPGADPPTRADKDALAVAARIDKHLADGWSEAKVKPAPAAGDAEFLRRVSLHLAGRIPSVAEVRAFLRDTSADKRLRV